MFSYQIDRGSGWSFMYKMLMWNSPKQKKTIIVMKIKICLHINLSKSCISNHCPELLCWDPTICVFLFSLLVFVSSSHTHTRSLLRLQRPPLLPSITAGANPFELFAPCPSSTDWFQPVLPPTPHCLFRLHRRPTSLPKVPLSPTTKSSNLNFTFASPFKMIDIYL